MFVSVSFSGFGFGIVFRVRYRFLAERHTSILASVLASCWLHAHLERGSCGEAGWGEELVGRLERGEVRFERGDERLEGEKRGEVR